ncbi:D-2-hydroxyacid dehydrogenase [Paraglaciecola sp. 2405UD69-4]|uniref:D-2-hydroxyacid dehydrogenase n=1 Tax=Paraglaciecola sp. 2405UD69-4 TaxID=3391836 RepID=UPI0039C9CF38
MHAVFLDQQTFSANISLDNIRQQVTSLNCFATTSPEQLLSRCAQADIVITNKVELTQNTLEQLPKLKLVCVAATGTNNVDLAAAAQLGIQVKNVAGYSTTSVSQYVFAQMLEYFNQTNLYNQDSAQGAWQKSPTFCYHSGEISELYGKKLGIVGYGNLGKAVAKIAEAFGMKILIAERPYAATIRQNRLSFEQVLSEADILTLHCPQTPETENLINAQTLSQMKPSAMLINTARGALVNSNDLHAALKNKRLGYGVLDVLEQEPPSADHILIRAISAQEPDLHLNNLKITAHIAWASIESQQRLLDLLADNISHFKSKC